MKFWKQMLLSVVLLSGIVVTVIYTSCVQNVCDNVTCQNGGSCLSGVCNCPTGYTGTQCQTLTVSSFLGTYAGTTSCNSLAGVIDTVNITANNALGITGVTVKMNSLFPSPPNKGYLYGTATINPSASFITVTNNDSTETLNRIYTVTLVNDTLLDVNEYIHDYSNPALPIVSTCVFRGYKTN